MGERCHHRRDACFNECVQHLSVCLFDVPDKSEVDAVFDRTFMGTDDIHVGTRQSESINTIGLKTCHKVFVDQSSIDHCHHFERLGICDPPSVHHLAASSSTTAPPTFMIVSFCFIFIILKSMKLYGITNGETAASKRLSPHRNLLL